MATRREGREWREQVLIRAPKLVGVIKDIQVPSPHPDACPRCGHIMSIGDFPFCSRFGQPWEHQPPAKYTPFKSFDYEADSGRVTIDSLHALRKVERESETRARNGGRPEIFRAYSQDRSNISKPIFGSGIDQHPKEGAIIMTEHEGKKIPVKVEKTRSGKPHFKVLGAVKKPSE